MDGSKAKLNDAAERRNHSHARSSVRGGKLCQTKLLLAESQEHHGSQSAIPTLRFALVSKLSTVGKRDEPSCKTSTYHSLSTLLT